MVCFKFYAQIRFRVGFCCLESIHNLPQKSTAIVLLVEGRIYGRRDGIVGTVGWRPWIGLTAFQSHVLSSWATSLIRCRKFPFDNSIYFAKCGVISRIYLHRWWTKWWRNWWCPCSISPQCVEQGLGIGGTLSDLTLSDIGSAPHSQSQGHQQKGKPALFLLHRQSDQSGNLMRAILPLPRLPYF